MRKIIKAVSLRKTFVLGSEQVHAVDDVSLEVDEGETVALVGASGSGKSTLLNLIGGLDRADEGQLKVLGRDLVAASERELAALRLSSVGLVFQDFNLFRDLELVENVALPLEGAGMRRARAREKAVKALARVGLEALARRFPDQVSGGQQQRAAIARAIVGDRRLVLADEPTGALDSTTGAEIMQLLRDLSNDGCTVVLSTHNPANLDFVDRVIALRDGREVCEGAPLARTAKA